MNKQHELFLEALHAKKTVNIQFNSESKGIIDRTCIPFDFGPSRRNLVVNPDRYHFYDLNSPDGKHTLSILPEQLLSLEITQDQFNPCDYITREPKWFVSRDRGKYS